MIFWVLIPALFRYLYFATVYRGLVEDGYDIVWCRLCSGIETSRPR